MNYRTFKIVDGKMKKIHENALDCTVYHISPVHNGKVLVNARLNQNPNLYGSLPAKLCVLNLVNGKLEYPRLNVVQRKPSVFNSSTFGIFGDVNDLPRYYNFFNSLNAFSSQNAVSGSQDATTHPLERGWVLYSNNVDNSIVFASVDAFITKYKGDYLRDVPVPA